MGLSGQLHGLVKEYQKDPSGQYKRHLLKLLELHDTGGMTKKDVAVFVVEWANGK
jgi:hypothetical protein